MTSANLWIGALEPWASWTSFMIWAKAVSFPTFVASNLKLPVLLMVAPMTSLPGSFLTGILSPVIIDSSTADFPSLTIPSTGIFSPGLTRTTSPTKTSSTGISISFPSLTTRAVLGCKPISFLMASEVCPFALASNSLPRIMRTMIRAEVSK